MQITDELQPWGNIREGFKGVADLGILLGNGASRAIWEQFNYDSLYKFACDPDRSNPLTPVDQKFFDEMSTTNFETVLSALATSRMVCRHLNVEHDKVEARYQSIRYSLLSAIREIHVGFKAVPDSIKSWLAKLLHNYRYVYTLNYDLLLYWAVMTEHDLFKDFIWGPDNAFDENDSHEWKDATTKVLYLHGGLHLYHDASGITYKKTFSEDDGDLLSQFDVSDERIPLFVSEGTFKDKLRSIRSNGYLGFAYWKLQFHRGPLVVFGSSLSSEFDQHIVAAMQGWRQYDATRLGTYSVPGRRIAIAVFPEMGSDKIIDMKNRLLAALEQITVEFALRRVTMAVRSDWI